MVIHDVHVIVKVLDEQEQSAQETRDRKSTRLNSSHSQISYAVFCLKKKNARCRAVSWQHRAGKCCRRLLALRPRRAATAFSVGGGVSSCTACSTARWRVRKRFWRSPAALATIWRQSSG